MVIPVAILFVQVFNSLRVTGVAYTPKLLKNISFAILIPAHNEEDVIEKTLLSVKAQVSENDRILVVADNCTDNTKDIANGLNVEVVIRSNKHQIGKGYALEFGIDYLSTSELKPDVLVIMDADCLVTKGEIKNLAVKSNELNRPAQALYLMHSPNNSGIGTKMAEFAWLVKNLVRPLGYKNLKLPCQLTGSGMAFPWSIVDSGKFKNANIVEDLKLGIDYTIEGYPPVFFPELTVSSCFPVEISGKKSQRKRWEHGHLTTIIRQVPRLAAQSIVKRNFNCMALAADLFVPPLALLSLLLIILNTICIGYALMEGGILPFVVSLGILTFFCIEVLVAWHFFGRKILSAKQLLYVPVYILKKVPLYLTFLVKRQVQWVKTTRTSDSNRDRP